jgi:copper transport protein
VLSNVAPPYVTPAPNAAASALLGAPPPLGPTVHVAGQAGWLQVYLTASRGQLVLGVRAPGDTPAQDVRLSLSAQTPTGRDIDLFPRPCGPGCYSMHVTWQRGTTVLHVQVAARGWTGGALTLAVPWPPLPLNPGLLARTLTTMRPQRAILVREQVISGPGASAHNVFRLSGARFMATEPYGSRVPDVRSMPSSDGLAQLVIYLPGSHIWVHLWIDTRHRLRREVIVAPGHLIQHTFSYPHDG